MGFQLAFQIFLKYPVNPVKKYWCSTNWLTEYIQQKLIVLLLPHCMHCIQRGLAMRNLSICSSSVKRMIRDKTKESCSHIVMHMKDHLS